ncbi:hypothetical protein [Halorubrum vacuolatum]|uniref:Uncharacterized protein n=1 Tax=Halorubrum vacuolatum TaxID=63740 RepID=A0A238UPC2_HALVU|nr:hypothetical protein [Halorubrum vacuolatum]SNR23497.1 hypothetical protein SAMN06264855_101128 [Halorubrum vacuolatum]
MPSTSESTTAADPRLAVRPIVRRYHRLERVANWLLALSVAGIAILAILSLPFLVGVAAALGVFLLVRLPIARRRGTTRLETETDSDGVRAAFEGPLSPPLVLQWGFLDANDVTVADGVVRYEVAYLFGLRSVTMRVETAEPSAPVSGSTDSTDVDELDLLVTIGDTRWATYTVTIGTAGDRTVVDIAWRTERRVDVRYVIQGFIGRRYYPAALDALGYRMVTRVGSWKW